METTEKTNDLESVMEGLYSHETYWISNPPTYVQWLEMELYENVIHKRDSFAQVCVNFFKKNYDLDIPFDDMVEIVGDPMISEWYGLDYDQTDDNFDTCIREAVLNLVSKNLLDMDWPCYGDTEEYREEFPVKFAKAAKDKGWFNEDNIRDD